MSLAPRGRRRRSSWSPPRRPAARRSRPDAIDFDPRAFDRTVGRRAVDDAGDAAVQDHLGLRRDRDPRRRAADDELVDLGEGARAGRRFAVIDLAEQNVGRAPQLRSHTAISRVAYDSDAWQPAVRQDGEVRKGAAVVEVTDLVDLSDWPAGTRLIIRREPLHPGAQQSLFPSECYRYWGHYTDATSDPVDLDRHMRAHAHVEDNIRRLKDSAAARFPFCDFDANAAWLAVVCMSDALIRWFQQLCLTGPLTDAEPKTLRWSLWHTPARIVHRARARIVRILDNWPSAAFLLEAYQRIDLIT